MLRRIFSNSFPHFPTKLCWLFFRSCLTLIHIKNSIRNPLTRILISESIDNMGRVQPSANSVLQTNNFDMGSLRFPRDFCLSRHILPNDKSKQSHPLEPLKPIKSTRSCLTYLPDFHRPVNDVECEIRRRNWYFRCANRFSWFEGCSFCKYIAKIWRFQRFEETF